MNLYPRSIPVSERRLEGGAHPRLTLTRVAWWPLVRGNATWIVPPAHAGPMGTCPYCHNEEPLAFVCDDRPEDIVGDYDTPCPVCNLPIAFHGILGVVFCGGCGGALRTRNEVDVGSCGFQMAMIPAGSPPMGDGGPDFYDEVWKDEDYDTLECRDVDSEWCFLCHRELPISAFHYSSRQYQRDHGGWRCSTRCRRCERERLEDLYVGPTVAVG